MPNVLVLTFFAGDPANLGAWNADSLVAGMGRTGEGRAMMMDLWRRV